MKKSFFERVKASMRWRAGQALHAPGQAIAFMLSTPYHDYFLARQIRRDRGVIPAGPKICIYTIFPTNGIQTSHMDTLLAAVAAGYSPVVVSNQPLSDADRALLSLQCTQMIVRPNFGYDFGAFRTGILSIQAQAGSIEDLVLINDSIWFPVGSGNWLQQVTSAKKDLVAAVSNYGIRLTSPEKEDGIVGWDYDPTMPRFHYCSFALRIGPAILSNPGFWRFWKRFRLTNDKIKTIQRGEVGFSRWVIENGFSHTTTYPIDHIPSCLENKDGPALRTIAKMLIIPEDQALRHKRDQYVQDTALSDNALRNFILDAIAQTGPAYAAANIAIDQLGISFLKKSPLWLDAAGAAVTVSLLQRHCPKDYLSEAQTICKIKNLPLPAET